jgi:hypothetical protein
VTDPNEHHVAVFHDKHQSGQWIAVCRECTPALPIPFGDNEAKARAWAEAHESPPTFHPLARPTDGNTT